MCSEQLVIVTQKQLRSEAATGGVLVKKLKNLLKMFLKMFFKISQYAQENTLRPAIVLKRDSNTGISL